MKIFETRHFREFKVILVILGLWPFQTIIQRNCARCFVLASIFSILTSKVIKFFELIHDLDGAIECMPMIIAHLVSLTKYLNWIVHADKLKKTFVHMERDGETLVLSKDIAIMEDWLERIRSSRASYATGIFTVVGIFFVSPAVPRILDLVVPLNESRPLVKVYQTEHFVDEEKYYCYILLHTYISVGVSMAILVYADILLGTQVHYACAMFNVLRSYLENIHLDNSDATESEEPGNIKKKITHCVRIHSSTLEFADDLDSSYSSAWFIMLTLCTFVITLTGTVAVIKLDNPTEATKYITFSVANFLHLYYTNFQAQMMIEESEAVFHSAYFSDWYDFPPTHQRLLIPIMMRSITPCKISAGKVFILSMDLYSSVIQKSMSFFTLLSSVR